MKRFLLTLGFLCGISFAFAAASGTVAFVDVTVLPMDTERVLTGQTVIVKGERITEIGQVASVRVPEGAQKIDGRGKFLIPGLAELHGHNPPLGSSKQYFEDVFYLFVANGVTTVRSMQGFAGQLEWREKARKGEIVAPTLYLAGPSFSGQSVPSPQTAIDRVRAQKAEGWDLLKIHPGIKPEVYTALAKTAKEVGIEFSGHVPADVGLVECIKQGQRTVDHLDGYIEHLRAKDGPIDPAKLAEIVKFSRESGVWVVPTMPLWEVILGALDQKQIDAYPELKYMPRAVRESWKKSYASRQANPNFNREQARRIVENRNVLLKALHDGGVKIIFGTDAPQQYSVPGFSIHRELAAMRAVGMSNFAVLQSATKNVGDYYEQVDAFGTVATGQRADLVLLRGNPLEDLAHVAKRAGVMVRGRWLAESDIQAGLAQIAARGAE